MWIPVLRSRFADPFSDFAFKKLFGRRSAKLFLIDFLNALIQPKKPIINITYLNTGQLGQTKESRHSAFDIYCEDIEGNKFVIEIQRILKPFFLDRAIFYSSFAIQDQAVKGQWDFNIKKTYTICLLDYCFDKKYPDQVVHEFKLIDTETYETNEQLIIYNIELPKFKKRPHQIITRLDVWLYVLNNLTKFVEIPDFLKTDPVFKDFFMAAEICNFNRKDKWAYLAGMKQKWEAYSTKIAIKKNKEEARKEGREEGKEEGWREGKREGKREGREEGRVQGRKEGRNETYNFIVKNLLQHTSHSHDEIAKLANVSLDFVINIAKQISK